MSGGRSRYSGWQSKATRRSNADLDHEWEVQKQRQRDAEAAAQKAATQPAANDSETEKQQNG